MERPNPEQPMDLPLILPTSKDAQAQQHFPTERDEQGGNLVERENRCEAVIEPLSPKAARRKGWQLTAQAFALLCKFLDEGADSEGQRYVEIQRRLTNFFDREGCHKPEELADITLQDVARRLAEEGWIVGESPAQYCSIRAKYTVQEYWRERKKHEQEDLDELSVQTNSHPEQELIAQEDERAWEKKQACSKHCLRNLKPENHYLIIRYYTGEHRERIENRRLLAAELQVSLQTLRVRASRLRDKLEACISACVEAAE